MAEVGIIASVVQIADVGLRLSIKLYTFGEIVASADRSVISISKDVSLTSGVLKELGQILDKDKETGTFSETAIQTADGVVKECLEVFKEMDNIIVKRLPSLGTAGKGGGQGERVKRATVMLERLKWGYLQPKLELLRSNLDSLKSTLLLMLNVITYARQVSEKAELPSVIAEQKCLIEDLAQSNQEYILKFERLKLGIEEPAGGPVDDASRGGVVEMEPRKSLSGTLTRKLKRMKFAIAGTSLQDKGSTRGLGSEEFNNNATWPSRKAQSSTTGSLATPPNADTDNMFINTSVQDETTRPPVQERGIPTPEAQMAFGQEVLFKQLEHHSMLIKNLLKEVDEAQYRITLQSRWRMRGGIEGLYEGEKRDMEKMWGLTALQSAVQRLDSLEEGIGELPRVNGFAAPVASANDSPFVTERFFKAEPVAEGGLIGQTRPTSNATATPHPASIDPSSTPLVQPVHEALPQVFPEFDLSDSNMPSPALTLEIPSDTPTVTRAPRARPALTIESMSMSRAETAKAKAEEQRPISRRKDTGDRIIECPEPYQDEDDTGEGGVEMTTAAISAAGGPSLRSSAVKQSKAIWWPGTELAAPDRSAPRRRGLRLHSLFVRERPLIRSYANHARSHQHSLQANGARPAPVDEGDTEEPVVKRADGEGQIRHGGRVDPLEVRGAYVLGDSGDSQGQRLPALHAFRYAPARHRSSILRPAPAEFQPQIEQGDLQLANEDLVNRLISLWTTVKP